MSAEPAVVLDAGHEVRYAIRGFLPGDEGVILDPWWKQIRKVAPYNLWHIDRFRGYKRDVIEPLVARCGVVMACNIDHPRQVYGWACGETTEDDVPILHMVYVRDPFRGKKIGHKLAQTATPALGHRAVFFTFKTKSTRYWEGRWGLVYAPQLIHPWSLRAKAHLT